VIAVVLSALDVISGNKATARCSDLKTFLTDVDEDLICHLENYAVTWNIKYSDWTTSAGIPLRGPGKENDEEEEKLLGQINEARTRIMEKIRRGKKFRGQKNGPEFCRFSGISCFHRSSRNAFAKSGNFFAAGILKPRRNIAPWEIFLRILDLVAVIFGDEVLTVPEFKRF
jgi:ATP-dependent helicase/DNAse subunit B